MAISSSMPAAQQRTICQGLNLNVSMPNWAKLAYTVATVATVFFGLACAVAGAGLAGYHGWCMYQAGWPYAPISVMQFGMGALIFSTLPQWLDLARRLSAGWSRNSGVIAEANDLLAEMKKKKESDEKINEMEKAILDVVEKRIPMKALKDRVDHVKEGYKDK